MRYFDKTFFKFTLGFLIIIAISLLIMYAASAYAAGTSKIVILPVDPLTILPNTRSGQMTVQSQDESGTRVKTTEKIILKFESSSNTGKFSESSGNELPNTISISSGGYNKNFSYKDSTEGTFIITVYAEGEITHQKWTATKQITISSDASQNNDSSNSSSSSQNYENIKEESTTNVSTPGAKLEILAGENRITAPGSPIWFQATIKKNTTATSPELNWSFGDGNVGIGPLVSHTYKYPGNYVVVLSAKAGDIFSVSRLKVKVTDSNISIIDKGQYLEISNNGNAEVNLFNWKIENEGRGFVFQLNTIVLAKSSIKLDKSLLTMKGYDNSLGISLKNSLKEEVFAVAPVEKVDLAEASEKLENIKKEVLVVQNKIPNTVEKTATFTKTFGEPKEEIDSTENIIYEVPKPESFVAKLTNFIKRVFSN